MIETETVLLSGGRRDAADHLCSHPGCSRWGGWGYDGGEGISAWWCIAHRPDADPVHPTLPEDNWVSDGNEG